MNVDNKTDLCLRLMIHAAFDNQCEDITPKDIRAMLTTFFPLATIQAAEDLIQAGHVPPLVDLSAYTESRK